MARMPEDMDGVKNQRRDRHLRDRLLQSARVGRSNVTLVQGKHTNAVHLGERGQEA
jgi:hypothetical protein